MTRTRAAQLLVAAGSIAGLLVAPAAHAVEITSIAQLGQAANDPGGATLHFGQGIGTYTSNVAASHPGIAAFATPLTSTADTAIYAGTPGSLTQIARDGRQAAGLAADINYDGFGFPILSANGAHLAFQAHLSGPGVTFAVDDAAAFVGSAGGGGVTAVARAGMQAPGLPAGVTFASSASPSVSNAGQMLFDAWVSGPGVTPMVNDQVIYAGTPAAPQLLARTGSQAAALPAGVNYAYFGVTGQNAAGVVAFPAGLTGPGTNPDLDEAFLVGQPGALAVVARTGDQAPELPAGVKFGFLDYISVNTAGKLLYQAELTGPGVDASNDYGLWSGPAGATQLVWRVGDQAPGAAAGALFTFMYNYEYSESGDVALRARVGGAGVDDSNDVGIWLGNEDGLDLIAREGAPAPGLGGGQLFHSLFALAISPGGRAAFSATFGPTGAGEGLWITDDAGELRKLLATGDVVDIDGVPRTVSDLYFEGQPTDEHLAMDASDRLYVRLSFADGHEGVYAVRLPEPAALPAAAALAGLLSLRRRRRRSSSHAPA